MWLQMTGLLDNDVSFIVSEPDTTLTMPSDAKLVITAGGYNSLNDAILLESGRGFDADGGIKPDLVAPAVDITGANLRGMYIALSGTSAAPGRTGGPHDPSGHGAARNRRTGADVIEFCDLTALDFRKIFLSLQRIGCSSSLRQVSRLGLMQTADGRKTDRRYSSADLSGKRKTNIKGWQLFALF